MNYLAESFNLDRQVTALKLRLKVFSTPKPGTLVALNPRMIERLTLGNDGNMEANPGERTPPVTSATSGIKVKPDYWTCPDCNRRVQTLINGRCLRCYRGVMGSCIICSYPIDKHRQFCDSCNGK